MKAALRQNRDQADGERQIEGREKKPGREQEPLKRIPDHGFLKVRAERSLHDALGALI